MSDILTKAITKDGFFNISAVVTTETVNKAHSYHKTLPVASAALGRLMTSGLLMASSLKEDAAGLTLQMRGDGPLGTLVAVADSKGGIKGYVSNPTADIPLRSDGKLDVGRAVGKGTLSVIRDLKMKEPYIGQIPIQTGEIGDDLAYYYMQSEQIPSVVALGVLVDRDYTIKHSGGFLVQVMPGCSERSFDRFEKSIQGITGVTDLLARGMDGAEIIKYVMLGFDVDILGSYPVGYNCGCSRERMKRAIISLGQKEINDIIEEQGQAEITCHFCNTSYSFDKDELSDMLKKAVKA